MLLFVLLSLAAVDTGSGAFWAAIAVAVGAGGAITKGMELWGNRAAKREERENAEIERLWSQMQVLQNEVGELKAEVKQLRTEKHDAINKLSVAAGELSMAKADADKWKKAAHYWYAAGKKAAGTLGSEKAKACGLTK